MCCSHGGEVEIKMSHLFRLVLKPLMASLQDWLAETQPISQRRVRYAWKDLFSWLKITCKKEKLVLVYHIKVDKTRVVWSSFIVRPVAT